MVDTNQVVQGIVRCSFYLLRWLLEYSTSCWSCKYQRSKSNLQVDFLDQFPLATKHCSRRNRFLLEGHLHQQRCWRLCSLHLRLLEPWKSCKLDQKNVGLARLEMWPRRDRREVGEWRRVETAWGEDGTMEDWEMRWDWGWEGEERGGGSEEDEGKEKTRESWLL